MNFFELQDKARTNTKWLIANFILAVISLVALTNLLIIGVSAYLTKGHQPFSTELLLAHLDLQLILLISAAMIIVILSGSLYKISALSAGGQSVAKALGGEQVMHSTDNLQQQTLLNVVEEMAIASGMPVPPVYLLVKEDAINAFAAGFSADDAVIGISQGALDNLNREELQGVVAHEFSHIVNGDMRLNMRVTGVLHGILLIALIGLHILNASGRSRRSKKGGQAALIGLGFYIIGYTGVFFGNLIKASLSRQREYLADASAVQFTRNNNGIANALKKVAGIPDTSKLHHPEAQSFSHAFFADAINRKFSSLFATHPPLTDRIKRLDPRYRGKPSVSQKVAQSQSRQHDASASFISQAGALATEHLTEATTIIQRIPKSIKSNLYTLEGAEASLYALLMSASKSDETHKKQLDYLATQLPVIQVEFLTTLLPEFYTLEEHTKLPILEIILPNLRGLSQRNFERLMSRLNVLIDIDNRRDIFEWTLFTIVSHYLKSDALDAAVSSHRYKDFRSLSEALSIYISFIATTCSDVTLAKDTVNRVKAHYRLPDKVTFITQNEQLSIETFDEVIGQLKQLYPKRRQQLLELTHFIMTMDDKYCHDERQLMRAIAESLACPLPVIPTTH